MVVDNVVYEASEDSKAEVVCRVIDLHRVLRYDALIGPTARNNVLTVRKDLARPY
jgi:hypothetical protein